MSAEQNFGYRQELNRTMGGFSSFAISFSLISVLTGIFANFNFGFLEVGGWIIWSWTLVAIGQFLLAGVMANLAIRFPIAGYGYQWTTRLVNPHFGFFIGWMLLIQFLTGFPGIAQTAAVTLSGLMNWNLTAEGIIIVTILIISAVTLIHLWGIRAASKVNDWGVYAELLGVATIILVLVWSIVDSGVIELRNIAAGIHYPSAQTPGFSAMALSLLLGAWCLTGFEAAADLAEETKSPEKTVPKAVIQSLAGAAVAGFIIIGLILLIAGDIKSAQGKPNPLIFILEQSMGKSWATASMIFVVISVIACAVASMATASRLLFSMSRDGMLPGSQWLSKVNPKTKTPQSATLTVCVLSCLSVLTFKRIEVITAVSALASFIGYAGIMFACVREGNGKQAIAAFIWSLIVIAALSIPATGIPGIETRHLPAWSALVVLIAGALIYFLFIRRKILNGTAGPPKNIQNKTE